MMRRLVTSSVAIGLFVVVAWMAQVRSDNTPKSVAIPEMNFNEVKELAPGVFFRYSSISATDKSIPFGGSNHTWIVFKDYVLVIDANFPKEAKDVVEAIKKTTRKPIKYVLDTHHHGDHAYGNAVWAKEGAQIIAHTNAARLLKVNGPTQWDEQAKSRSDVKESTLKQVDIPFDDIYVLDDGTQRVEFYQFGHSHTIGDAVAYLPNHKILCTGDACVNGAFNFMGHSNSASWIRSLEKMQKLDVAIVCPGHGKPSKSELISRQKRYFVELREQVQKGITAKKEVEEIAKGLDMPWYKNWTGVSASENLDNVKHVYAELMGKINHERLGAVPASRNLWEVPSTVRRTAEIPTIVRKERLE